MTKKQEFKKNEAAAQTPVTDEALTGVVGGIDLPLQKNPNCPQDGTELKVSGTVTEIVGGVNVEVAHIKYQCPTCGSEYVEYIENGECVIKPLHGPVINNPGEPYVPVINNEPGYLKIK